MSRYESRVDIRGRIIHEFHVLGSKCILKIARKLQVVLSNDFFRSGVQLHNICSHDYPPKRHLVIGESAGMFIFLPLDEHLAAVFNDVLADLLISMPLREKLTDIINRYEAGIQVGFLRLAKNSSHHID